ncbi:response regulator transcription factor [Bordetella petrii]|uniref:response regulator transcription factor n=1 Tax=Bordetella petrii TaxID=94624 RepID=UPI001E2DA328|nr:winged helix-turn-helix domain-containing protein [Bordetella petrii]MCD0505987.1 winged helix-turn-helix domain-containing protein [Bordetella petrii]
MNRSLDVLFLTGDDTAHPQQIADLSHLGFQVHRYAELADLYTHVSRHPVPLVVLTGTLPKIHLAAAQLRAMRQTLGIIALTTFADSEARVRTLLCGADACLDTSSSGLELAAVFQSLLRRVADLIPSVAVETSPQPSGVPIESTAAAESVEAPATGWRLASKGWTLIAPAGQELALTTAERGFLLRLVRAPDKKVSRDTLIADGMQSGEAADSERRGRFVDVMISRMRRKAAAHQMRLPIKAVHGWGYMFTADVVEDAGASEDGSTNGG